MAPTYFLENRYSFVIDAISLISNNDYEVDTPETSFERNIQHQLALANHLLITGKYSAALTKYRHIRGLIAATIRPQISILNASLISHAQIDFSHLAKPMVAISAELLRKTPVTDSIIPETFRSSSVALPAEVIKQFSVAETVGIKDRESGISGLLEQAVVHVNQRQFDQAGKIFESLIEQTDDIELRGSLFHDLAIVRERAGNRDEALKFMQTSIRMFAQQESPDMQTVALTGLAGIQSRGTDLDRAAGTLKTLSTLQKERNVFPIIAGRPIINGNLVSPLLQASAADHLRPKAVPTIEELEARPVQLLATEAFARRKTQKQMTVVDSAQRLHNIRLDDNASDDLGRFFMTLRTTSDVGLLMGYFQTPTTIIAYLTHVYSWVIPMAVGDCLAALGSYEEAEGEYLSTLNYPFLNESVETVNLWVRLAELYLDWGDRLYRQARNDVSEFGKAREKYERLLRLDNTIDINSKLYKHPKFANITTRVSNAIQAVIVNGGTSSENPRIVMALLRARMQIFKIDNQLNFIGLGVHIPPFSFEYLQNLARYFAQHASQVEQMYIQFKSTGENEELREEQMAQQAELASASVELELRGLDESREGVDVASANLNYTNVQLNNATEMRDQFNSVRAELQEISRLQAWAGSVSDDEIKLNVVHASYYSADSKPRSHVLFDLANRRAQISNQIESTRLQNEVDVANAYRAVAQQQVQQAQARVAVAQQRVAIAQLQEQHARENLDFLTGREFSSAMWYNLAREARRLTGRYLDMAIEVATLMEKAYEAETGRDLRKIKFEYGLGHLNGLLGAEALLLDIDYFSLDFVRTKSKKAQMKQVISLADTFPGAFTQLIQSGRAFFETTLQHFDRRYPGFYLQKVKQVEMLFVGLNGTEGVHGTLRNIGLSQFRQKNGTVVNQVYPADVMPLSEYDIKQDAIAFQLDSRELRLFENNGIATMWQLDLPRSTNTFDLEQILDIQMVLYYDGFFDPALEQQIVAALPGTGSGARALGLRLYAPDELFFLKSQGSARLEITPQLFPANQTNQVLTRYRIQAIGDAATINGLNLRIDFAKLNGSHTFQLNNSGAADDAAFAAPINQSLFDTWTLTIDPAANPGVDLAKLDDIAVYVEYNFDYRN